MRDARTNRTALLSFVLMLFGTLPALAGHWNISYTAQGTCTYSSFYNNQEADGTQNWKNDSFFIYYTSHNSYINYGLYEYFTIGGMYISTSSGTYQATLTWIPYGSLSSDPPPAKVYVSEHAMAYWGMQEAQTVRNDFTGSADDGCGDPCVVGNPYLRTPFIWPKDFICGAASARARVIEVDGHQGTIVLPARSMSASWSSRPNGTIGGAACVYSVSVINPLLQITSTNPSNPIPIILTSIATSVPLSATLVGQPNDTVTVTPTLYDSAQGSLVSLPAQSVTLDIRGNGTASFTWNGMKKDGTAAPPGIYLFQLNAADRSTSDTDTDKSPYLTISTPGTDAQLVLDDGTNAKFAISYTLSSTDSPARSAAAGQIDVYDPNQAKVITQTLSAGDLTPGAHTIIVSLPSPQVTGDYIFLISAQDNDADNDKAGRQRWALQHNTKYKNIPPIIYINSDMWHVAWCVAGRNVNRATLDIPISERAAHYVPNLVNNVNTADVRAGVNGAVYNQKVKGPPIVIGGVGTGTPGVWHIGGYSDRKLFCFGMTGSGNGFGQALMKSVLVAVRVKGQSRLVNKYTVAPNIENQYPYGLGTVGLIIDNGIPRSHSYLGQWDTTGLGYPPGGPPRLVPRTAVGWTANGDFFLISCNGPNTTTPGAGATWEDVQSFLITTLPQLIQQQYKKTITISNAVMMDGGGSVQFAYRWQHSDGSILKSDNGAPQGDNDRAIPSAISVYATTDK